MLTIVVGSNGSGKSLWALHQIIYFLLNDNRLIVTSMALDLGRLNEYLQEQHPKQNIDVTRRLVLITKEQMKTFWRVRGLAHDEYYGRIPVIRGPYGDESWRDPDGGVIYVLEEAQTTFGAREWQKTGPEFCGYQSQHRHHGDDVIAISPAAALLDKQFRVLCGECVALNNLYRLRVGIIKAPRRICYSIFQNCPPAPGETPLQKGHIYIDPVGLASCYRTQDSVEGIGGLNADKGKEAKGIPFWIIFPAIATAAALAWLGLTKVMNWGVHSGFNAIKIPVPIARAAATNAPAPPPTNPLPHVQPGFGSLVLSRPSAPATNTAPALPPGQCYGYGLLNGRYVLELVSGRLLWGTNFVDHGDLFILDGREFAVVNRQKKP